MSANIGVMLTKEQEAELYQLLRPVAAFTIKSEEQAIKEAIEKIAEILGIDYIRGLK